MSTGQTLRATLILAASCSIGSSVSASSGRAIDIPERTAGADRVVVATATAVTSAWRQNSHGDRLIVSQVLLSVEETLKGTPSPTAVFEMEGGTIGDTTLRVSDMPELHQGERAVFFLDRTQSSVDALHLRGLGLLKLDSDGRVSGSSLSLVSIRRMAKTVVR